MKRKQGKGKRKPKATTSVTAKSKQVVQDVARYYNEAIIDSEPSDGANVNSRMEVEAPQEDKIVNNPLDDFGRVVLSEARIDDNMSSCAVPPSVNPSKKPKSLVRRSTRGVASSSMRTNNNAVDETQVERSLQRQSKLPHKDALYKDQELKACLEVIRKVMELDAALPFNIPVDITEVPDYYDIIDTPMDFSTILHNLETRVKYENAKDVLCDAEHIWNNCFKYNKKGSFIMELGKRVMNKFSKLWAEAGLDKEPRDDINGFPHVSPAMPAPSFITHGSRMLVEQTVDHLQRNRTESNFGDCRHSMSCVQSVHPHMNYFQPNPSCCQMSHPQAHTDSVPGLVRQGYLMPPIFDCATCSQRNQIRGESQHHYHPFPLSSKALYHTHQDCLYPYQPHSSQQYIEMGAANGDPMTRYNKHMPQSPWIPMTNCHQHDHTALHRKKPHQDSFTYAHHQQPEHCTYQSHPGFSRPQPYHLPTDTGNLHQKQPHQDSSTHVHHQQPEHCTYQSHPSFSQPQPYQLPTDTGNLHQKQPHKDSSTHVHHQQPEHCTYQSHPGFRQPQPYQLPTETGNDRNDFALARTDGSTKRDPKRKPSLPEGLETNNQPQQEDQTRSSRPSAIIDFSKAPPAKSTKKGAPKRKASLPANLVTSNHPQQKVQVQSCRPIALTGNTAPSPSIAGTPRHETEPQVEPVDDSQNSMPLGNFSEGSHELNVNSTQPPPSTSSPVTGNSSKKQGNRKGPSNCLDLWNSTTKISITFDEFGQPIGNDTPKLITFLGTLARNGELAPLNYVDWRTVPKMNKEKMWILIQSKFDIDPRHRDWITKSVGKKWKDWKAHLKSTHYLVHDNNEDRLADCDERVFPDQWKVLVEFWNSDTSKARSIKAKNSRSKQRIHHTTGRKSFARIREEQRAKMPDREPPSKADLFIFTRTRKDGRPVNEESSKLISALREQVAQLPEGTSKDGGITDEIFSNIVKFNRSDMFGPVQPTPQMHVASMLSKVNDNEEAIQFVSEAKKDAVEIRQKILSIEQSYAQITDQMTKFVSIMSDKNAVNNPNAQITGQMTKFVSIMSDMHDKNAFNNPNAPDEPVPPNASNVIDLPSSLDHVERVVDVTTPNNNSTNSEQSSSKELFELPSERVTRKRAIPQRTSSRKKVPRKKK